MEKLKEFGDIIVAHAEVKMAELKRLQALENKIKEINGKSLEQVVEFLEINKRIVYSFLDKCRPLFEERLSEEFGKKVTVTIDQSAYDALLEKCWYDAFSPKFGDWFYDTDPFLGQTNVHVTDDYINNHGS